MDTLVSGYERNAVSGTTSPARAHSEIAEQFLHYAALAKCVCKQPRLARCNREIPRVQIEDLCEGCISLSIAEGLQKNCTMRFAPLTSI